MSSINLACFLRENLKPGIGVCFNDYRTALPYRWKDDMLYTRNDLPIGELNEFVVGFVSWWRSDICCIAVVYTPDNSGNIQDR